MSKEPLPHQIEDAAFLASKSFAGNFSGMGSGKTLTALEAIALVRDPGEDKIIIVCPPIAMNMWQIEFADYLSADAQIVKTGKTKLDGTAAAYILSYEIATKRFAELKELAAKVLIFDESHALKNMKAKRTRFLIGKHGLCESATHTWCLTGTPSTRWNDDLFTFMCRAGYSQLKEKIGKVSFDRFNMRYCIVQTKQWPGARFPVKMTVGSRNTVELNEMLFGGMAVRRELKEVWAAMPPITKTRYTIKLDSSDELKALLKDLANKNIRQIEKGLVAKDESLSRTRRLLGMAKVRDSAKLIAERVEDGSGPVLVGAWHTDVIDSLKASLTATSDLSIGILDGRSALGAKSMLQEAFNDGKLDVLIGQIAAMGVAIDLQHGGNNIICVEEDWSPAIMDQFYARMHRMGQANHVHVEILESDTKLDKVVSKIAGRKAAGHNQLMEQVT